MNKEVLQSLARLMLLELVWRAYRWGLMDLRRFRLTPAAGYVRVEAESVALLLLFRERPDLAERWMNPNEDMLNFFHQTQPDVKRFLEQHKLKSAYEQGSAIAQHARFASVARGIRIRAGDVQVLDQEFDPEKPVTFHLGLAYFLRIQKRIFDVLPLVFVGLHDDTEFKTAVAEFDALEKKTWWVLERKYKREIEDFHTE